MIKQPLFQLTITESDNGVDVDRVAHCEKFDSYGAMNLWVIQWVKTLGIWRSERPKGQAPAKEYIQHKESFGNGWFNWYGTEDFSNFSQRDFITAYYRHIDELVTNPRRYGRSNLEYLGHYGLHLGCVELMKQKYVCKDVWVKKLAQEEWV